MESKYRPLSSIVLDIDTYGDSDNTTGGIPNLLENVYSSPDGLRLYTPYSHANILRGMYLSEEELTHETSCAPSWDTWTGPHRTEDTETRKHFDEKGREPQRLPSLRLEISTSFTPASHRYPSSIDSVIRF